AYQNTGDGEIRAKPGSKSIRAGVHQLHDISELFWTLPQGGHRGASGCRWRSGGFPFFAATAIRSCSITLNRPVEEFTVVNHRNGLVDTWQGSKVSLQAFDPLEEIKSCRSTFLAAVDYYVEILRAADLLTDDLVGTADEGVLFKKLQEVRIGTDAGDAP